MSIKIEIIKANLRHHLLMPFLAAVGILFLTAVLFPITALKGKDVSKPLEYFLPFVGVALLTPIFLPEQDSSIRDVVASKKINGSAIYKLRVLYSIAALLMLISIFVGIMYLNECEVRWYHFYGGFSSALFFSSRSWPRTISPSRSKRKKGSRPVPRRSARTPKRGGMRRLPV